MEGLREGETNLDGSLQDGAQPNTHTPWIRKRTDRLKSSNTRDEGPGMAIALQDQNLSKDDKIIKNVHLFYWSSGHICRLLPIDNIFFEDIK